MNRSKSRTLLNQRGASQLDTVGLSLLQQLISSVYTKGDNNADLELFPVTVSVPALAAKVATSESTAYRKLQELSGKGLITFGHQDNGKTVFTVHLDPMLNWETTKAANERKRKEKLSRRRTRDRNRRAMQREKMDSNSSQPTHGES